MEIRPKGSQPSKTGPADQFTGRVTIAPVRQADPPSRVQCFHVTFEPGARTHWHTHPLGQILVIVQGEGRVQAWGGEMSPMHPGDVVLSPPGEKHWHGAAPDGSVTHLAIQESDEGRAVDWLEPVTDDQYRGRPPQRS
jgi:quercetin dioxygenase-like cupin family protein